MLIWVTSATCASIVGLGVAQSAADSDVEEVIAAVDEVTSAKNPRASAKNKNVDVYVGEEFEFLGPGYYPTYQDSQFLRIDIERDPSLGEGDPSGYQYTESDLLGEPRASYARSRSGSAVLDGPDLPRLSANGLWPYPGRSDANFGGRVRNALDRIDQSVFQTWLPVVPGESISWTSELPGWGSSPDSGDPIYEPGWGENGPVVDFFIDPSLWFTRNIDPDRTHLKLGPLYADVLSIGMRGLFSDLSGTDQFGRLGSSSDDTIFAVDVSMRGLFRFTDTLYANILANFYVLDEGKVGFNFGSGYAEQSRAGLVLEEEFGNVDVILFDDFRVIHRLSDLLEDVEIDKGVRSGRYTFGRYDDPNAGVGSFSEFLDDAIFLHNSAGIDLSSILTRHIIAEARFTHHDFFFPGEFEGVRDGDSRLSQGHLQASIHHDDFRLLGIPFGPHLEYDTWAFDDYDVINHRLSVGVSAPLLIGAETPFFGRFLNTPTFRVATGIAFGDSFDGTSTVWNARVDDWASRTLRWYGQIGQDYGSTTRGREFRGDFYGGGLNWDINPYLQLSGFIRGENGTYDTPTGDFDSHSLAAGVNLTAFPETFTRLNLTLRQTEFLGDRSGRLLVYRLAASRRIFSRTTLSAAYQWTDFNRGDRDFDEQLVSIELRRFF